MNTIFDTWAAITSAVAGVVALFPRNRKERTQDQEKALIALSSAYHKTRQYLEYRESNDRHRSIEWDIAEKWHRAGILLRKYDKPLSKRLEIKSRFWGEGATWEQSIIAEARIGIETVWREVNMRLAKEP